MKKHEILFSTIKVPLDFCIVFLCFFLARKVRLVTDLIPGVNLPIQTIDTESLSYFAFLWALLYIILFSTHSLYNIKIINSKVKEFLDIIRYSFYWFVFFSVGVYLWNGILYTWIEIPRLIIFFTCFFSFIFVILERIILNNIQNILLKKKIIPKRKLLIISNFTSEEISPLLEDIENSKVYDIIGYINKESVKNPLMTYLWWLETAEKIIKEKKCDEILHIDSSFWKKDLLHIWNLSKTFNIRYRYLTNTFDVTKTNTTMSLINNIPVIEIKNTPLDNWGRVIKRWFDILWSMFGITKIGTFIEKYSIDELPQFFNVLIWNMSLVWPRPHQPREVKKYKLYQKRLLTIKPGISWMAQVNGRQENNFVKEAKLDIFYIENWSFILDIKIILKTFTRLKRK